MIIRVLQLQKVSSPLGRDFQTEGLTVQVPLFLVQ